MEKARSRHCGRSSDMSEQTCEADGKTVVRDSVPCVFVDKRTKLSGRSAANSALSWCHVTRLCPECD
jgi:hypothetical protein